MDCCKKSTGKHKVEECQQEKEVRGFISQEEPKEQKTEDGGFGQKIGNPDDDSNLSPGKRRSQDELPAISSLRKKQRQDDFPKLALPFDFKVPDLQINSRVLEKLLDGAASKPGTGSSGKRKSDAAKSQEGTDHKRRKMKCHDDDSDLKILGPVKLPDFKKEIAFESTTDQGILYLKSYLIEINRKLRISDFQSRRPENQRSPYETRIRANLIQERQRIISRLIQANPTFKPPSAEKPSKFFKKLYIPVKEYAGYNFVGLILGPRGNTQRKMQKETGSTIQVRGRGSSRIDIEPINPNIEDLHVYIEADNQKSVDSAVVMVERLLIPFSRGSNEQKLAQFQELHQPIGKNSSVLDSSKIETNVYVANLPQAVDDVLLKDLFAPFGKIMTVRVIRERDTGVCKGYGFVHFSNPRDAKMAVKKMNGYKLNGKTLAVRVAGGTPVRTASSPSSRTFKWRSAPVVRPVYSDVGRQGGFYPSRLYCSSRFSKLEQIPFATPASLSLVPGHYYQRNLDTRRLTRF